MTERTGRQDVCAPRRRVAAHAILIPILVLLASAPALVFSSDDFGPVATEQLTHGSSLAQRGTGDCNADDLVTIDEILLGINIALGNLTISECPNFDGNGDNHVTIDEILTVVNYALNGLPPPSGVAETVAGRAVLVANGMSAFPSVITALVSGLKYGSSAGALTVGDWAGPNEAAATAGDCPAGGNATRTCSSSGGKPTTNMTFNACQVTTPSGTVTVDGTVTATASSGSCPDFLFPPWAATINVTATFRDRSSATLLVVTANLSGTVNPQLDFFGSCKVSGAGLTLSGTLATQFTSGGSVSVALQNTSVWVAIDTFNPQCVPVNYSMTFNGPVQIASTSGSGAAATASEPLDVIFSVFVVRQNASTSPTQTWMDGGVSSPCFGGGVTLQTTAPLTQTVGQACPNSGTVRITSPPGQPQILYLPGGLVGLDTNLDGSSEQTLGSCFDALSPICRGLGTPTATPTASTSTTPTLTATTTPVPSMTPTATTTATPSATSTLRPSRTVTPTSTQTLTPTQTAPATLTGTATPTPTAAETRTTTATASPAPVSSTPTATPPASGVAETVAGRAVLVANGMSAFPSVITALVSGLKYGSSASLWSAGTSAGFGDGEGAASGCPVSGSAIRTCSSSGDKPTTNMTFNACQVTTPSGTVTVDGTVTATASSGSCPDFLFPPWTATINMTATFRDQSSATLLVVTANLSGTVNPQLDFFGSCKVSGADLTLSGMLATQFTSGGSVSVTFQNTSISVDNITFNAQCVPVNYSMTFNGLAEITSTSGSGSAAAAESEPLDVVFSDFVIRQDARTSPTQTWMDGGVSSPCFGGGVTLQTTAALTQTVGQACPNSGTVRITSPPGQPQILYLPGGLVGIDTNLDGVSDNTLGSCFDALSPICQGLGTPTPTPTASATVTPTLTATITATATMTPSETPTVSPTVSVTGSLPPSPTATLTSTRTWTPTATRTGTPTATGLGSATPTGTSSATTAPSRTATVTPTPSRTITPTASRTATTTASPTRTGTASPTPSATAEPQTYCDTLSQPALIPDNNTTGINNIITISDASAITDLNVRLNISHSWVGDLVVTLKHVQTGTTVTLLNRPGISFSADGCGESDIFCTFDDAAAEPADNQCWPSDPTFAAIDGGFRPTSPLSAFGGQSLAGSWQLNVSDRALGDEGSLLGWCLVPNTAAPTVSAFTCNGVSPCTLNLDHSFTLAADLSDVNGNANHYQLVEHVYDGSAWSIGWVTEGDITPPMSGGTLSFNMDPFTCPSQSCGVTDFAFVVVISDATGLQSPPAQVNVTVLGSQ